MGYRESFIFDYGTTQTNADGKWSMTFTFNTRGSTVSWHGLPGYPPGRDEVDWTALCIED